MRSARHAGAILLDRARQRARHRRKEPRRSGCDHFRGQAARRCFPGIKMETKATIPALQQMKRDGRKIVGVVAWDTEMARIADRAGVDLISVGDSVGVNLWGHATDTEVTVDEMLICCKAVRRGAKRALVSCDVPNGPVHAGAEAVVNAAVRLAKEGAADKGKG